MEDYLHPVATQVAEVQDTQEVDSLQLPCRVEDLLWKMRGELDKAGDERMIQIRSSDRVHAADGL